MFEKGSLIGVKKGLGFLLFIIGIGSLLNVSQINNIVGNYVVVKDIILIVSGILLWIAGRQG